MGKVKRAEYIVSGILMMAAAYLMVRFPDKGYVIVTLVLAVSLLLFGIKTLVYYFTMARHMVGGRVILYEGIILFDLGMFAMMISDMPKSYVILYLVIANLVAGVLDLLSSLELRRMGGHWLGKMLTGAIGILSAAGCLAFRSSIRIMVYIFCFGVVWNAVGRIVKAFRKTAIVYIQ